ncbi:MAG: hypothetical protein RR450_04780 [Oscillospiraceae bacterium]
MLVRLPNKLIAEHWEIFKEAYRQSVPATSDVTPERMTRLLEAAMTGEVQCWLFFTGEECVGAGISRKYADDISGQEMLLIYAYWMWKAESFQLQTERFEALKDFARGVGCGRIGAFLSDKRLCAEYCRLTGSRLTYLATVEV